MQTHRSFYASKKENKEKAGRTVEAAIIQNRSEHTKTYLDKNKVGIGLL